MGATALVREKVDIFTGGGENVFWIIPQNKFRAGCGRKRVNHWAAICSFATAYDQF